MTRIKLVLGLTAVVVALIAAAAVPALADDNGDRNDDFFGHDGLFFLDNGFDHFFNRNNLANLEFDQDIDETGNVSLSTNVSQSGDNSNQCVAPLQFGNTGNLQNAQGFTTFGTPFVNDNNNNDEFFPFFDGFFNNTGFDDVEFEGSTFEFTPTLTNTCDQSVEQAAAAGN